MFETMGALKNWMWLFSVLVVFVSRLPVNETVKKDNCEYDMDLANNVIKITCDGSASSVNVYAETAHVTGEDQEDNGDDGSDQVSDGDNEGGRRHNTAKPTKSVPMNDKSEKKTPQVSRRRSNKELRGGNPSPMDIQWEFSHYDTSAFIEVVGNASQKLEDARRKLTNYAGSLNNITNTLAEGDLHLRSDMDNLRRTSNTATELKEGIIAAMRNQYNFMKSAMLTHNAELHRVMNSLDVLVDVTSSGLQSALSAHKSSMTEIRRLNFTLTAVKKMVSAELRKRYRRRGLKKGKTIKACPKEISAIGHGGSRKMTARDGAYMVESYLTNAVSAVWIMKGSEAGDQIIQFDSATDIDYDIADRYYALPFSCQGTGHAVFRRHFYCHVKDTNTVIKYHLKKMDIVSEVVLPGTQYERFPYRSGANSEVDLAVDEQGLWAIYATEESGGKIVISKINHQKMEVDKTWVTKYFKTDVGNAFMICGVLYATNSHTDAPTYIRYTYNTETSTDQNLDSGQLPFYNSANLLTTKGKHRTHQIANSVMLNYDFKTAMLYSWSNFKVESFPVYFSNEDA